MNPPTGLDGVLAFYGDPKAYQSGNVVLVDPAWEQANMAGFTLPGYPKRVYMHKRFGPLVIEALSDAIARCPGYVIRSVGCFSPRFKKRIDADGKTSYRVGALSIHSWGAAIDLNADSNPFGSALFDMPDEYVQAFESRGFRWGGRWLGRSLDAQHFQFAVGY